jgi:hypothetical protein
MAAGCRIHYLHWAREPARPGERGLLFVHGGGAAKAYGCGLMLIKRGIP